MVILFWYTKQYFLDYEKDKNDTYLLSLSSSLILFNLVNSSSSTSVSDPPILTLSLSTVSSSLRGEALGAEVDKGGYGSYTFLLKKIME